MYEIMSEDEALEIIEIQNEEIAYLKEENNELKQLYKYVSEQYLDTGVLFAEQLVESLKYQEEISRLKSSSAMPFDVKAEMTKIKNEIRELEAIKNE